MKLETVALLAGGVYVLGVHKDRNGNTIASKLGSQLGTGLGAGVAGAVGGFGYGVVKGVATVIPGADQDTGVGNWTVPISGGIIRGSPIDLFVSGAVLAHPEILWNLLPGLPDWTGDALW